MNNQYRIVSYLAITGLLSACQSNATVSPAAAAVPTAISQPPTSPPLPTETPKPTLTPLPEGVLFRDDFEGAFQPGWEWQDENPAKWTFTDDGWLQIIGEFDSLLGSEKQSNLLWYPLPAGDFVITVHLRTKPFANFQQAAIFIYEDPENYLTINRGYCGLCSTQGNGFYMDYKIAGEWGDYKTKTDAEDVYLRLESMDNILSGYYAVEPEGWMRLGRFGNYFQFKRVGLGVSNVGASEDVVGLFDYFEISLP
jgi:hypothetical protein